MARSLTWYATRLRAMSPREVAFRSLRTLGAPLWRESLARRKPAMRTPWREAEPADRFEATQEYRTWLLGRADAVAAGEVDVFGYAWHESPIDWHTGVPLGTPVGPGTPDPARLATDTRVIWEKNRLGALDVLGLAFALAHDERYSDAAERILSQWDASNPFATGVNWSSALETGIRLVSLANLERALRGSGAHARLFGRDGTAWPLIYRHLAFTMRERSVGSSANNHAIGEAAGVLVACLDVPVFTECRAWADRARRILEHETLAQVAPDGLTREQAFGYQLFVCELLLYAGIAADAAGKPMSDAFRARVAVMAEGIASLRDLRGGLPRYGDDDEGVALQVVQPEGRADMLLELARRYAGACVQPRPACPAEWLARGIDREPVPPRQHTRAFEDSGVYVMSSRRGEPDELIVLLDAGPLGYGALAAHGHADALALTLSVGGVPIIVDTGTGAYGIEPAWREYFRSTAAHNTVLVEGRSQSITGGPFMWCRRAKPTVLEHAASSEGGHVLAEHDGYRESFGVTHRRRVLLAGRTLTVADSLSGQSGRAFELRWHFHPACSVRLDGSSAVVEREGRMIRMELDPALTWNVRIGEPGAGWYSPRFLQRVPSPTLVGMGGTDAGVHPLVTRIEVGTDA